MNASLMFPEILVLLLGVGVLLIDLWTVPERIRFLGYGAAAGLLVILIYTFSFSTAEVRYAFGQSYVLDSFALFFKRFFLVAAIIVLVMSVEFADRIES